MDASVSWTIKRDAALATALVEARAASGARSLRTLAAELETLASTPDVERLEALASKARAMLGVEELLADGPPAGAAAAGMEAFVTRRQFTSPVECDVMTSLAEAALPAHSARALLAIVGELVAMVEADAPAERRVRLFLASEVDGGLLTLAFAAHGMDDAPVLGAAGARSLRRAEHLALLAGGDLVRGFRDGMMLVGITVAMAGG